MMLFKVNMIFTIKVVHHLLNCACFTEKNNDNNVTHKIKIYRELGTTTKDIIYWNRMYIFFPHHFVFRLFVNEHYSADSASSRTVSTILQTREPFSSDRQNSRGVASSTAGAQHLSFLQWFPGKQTNIWFNV